MKDKIKRKNLKYETKKYIIIQQYGIIRSFGESIYIQAASIVQAE